MNSSVGVVIPAYQPDVETLNNYARELRESIADIVHVELDAPTDTTLDALSAPDSIHVASERRGKGAAITTGFNTLPTDILVFADADGSIPTESITDVVSAVVEDRVDVATGSRRHPDATIISHQTTMRRYAGDAFAWLACQLLPTKLRDYQCGAKAITADAWDTVYPRIHESGFAWDIELLAIADVLGYDIQEVPVTWDDDPESTVDPFFTSVELATSLLTIRHRVKVIDGDVLHSAIQRLQQDNATNSG